MSADRVASLAALRQAYDDGVAHGWALGKEMKLPMDTWSRIGELILALERGSRLGEPSPEGRGTPSEAQMQAAREGWSGNLPLPSDAELRVIVEAVNRAAWPDRGVRAGSEETPQ